MCFNFQYNAKYSGMKLNLSKSTVIPLRAALEHDPPHIFPFKYLPANEEETLLGVPVSRIHDPNSAWGAVAWLGGPSLVKVVSKSF
jgi:hypothetical protein